MPQSEKIEGALPWGNPVVGLRLPERDQRRLRRMNAQAKARKPLGQPRHDPPGIPFPLAANDTVIRKADQHASSLQAWPDFLLEPFLQHMVEEYMGKDGGTDPAWHDAGLRLRQDAFCHPAGPQPLPNEAPDPPILAPRPQSLA
jgi:hypothetical protein